MKNRTLCFTFKTMHDKPGTLLASGEINPETKEVIIISTEPELNYFCGLSHGFFCGLVSEAREVFDRHFTDNREPVSSYDEETGIEIIFGGQG